jgi:hypothetical protein
VRLRLFRARKRFAAELASSQARSDRAGSDQPGVQVSRGGLS